MKLETLERFLNKDQDLWTREDLDKLISRYGKTAIFYDTVGLNNRLFLLFKCRDMLENDKKILDFIEGKSDDFSYIILFIDKYTMYLDFVMWPSEIGLHLIYKILCNRFLVEDHEDTFLDMKMQKLARHISLRRYKWIEKIKEQKGEDSNESK